MTHKDDNSLKRRRGVRKESKGIKGAPDKITTMVHTRIETSAAATLEVLLTRSLDERWNRFMRILTETRTTPSEKMVHDLRVATRRLISTVDLISTVLTDGTLQGIRAELINGLKGFNPLRDVQVQLLIIEELLPTYPVLEPFHTVLLLRERRLIKEIIRRLRMIPTRTMERDLQVAKQQLEKIFGSSVMHDVAFAAVVGAAAKAFARSVERRLHVDPKNTQSIHRLRIAFKRVRYTLEALQSVFPGITKGQFKAMNEYQQLMGDVQDIEVLRASLNAYAVRRRKTRDESLRAVQRELQQRGESRVRSFLMSADMLFDFWQHEFTLGVSRRPHSSRSND